MRIATANTGFASCVGDLQTPYIWNSNSINFAKGFKLDTIM